MAGGAHAQDAASLATSAGAHCKAGNAEAAATDLRRLYAELEQSLGPTADATLVVRLNLAHVEGALGNAAEAQRLGALPEAGGGKKPDSKLRRALKKLRACATVKGSGGGGGAAAPVEIALSDRVNLARNQLNRGRLREARAILEDARKAAGAKATPGELMRLYETLALIQLQLGDTAGALESAAAADRYAAKVSDVSVRITMARLTAQLGDLEQAGERLDALETSAKSKSLRAELEEARGDLALRLGAPRVAQGHLELALVGHQAAFGKSVPSTAAVLQLLGDAYRMAGDFPAAMQAYDEANSIQTKALGPNHANTARTLNAMGVLQADLGDWQAADASFAEAERRLGKTLGADHPEILTVRSNRALARWGAAESSVAAEEYAGVVDALRVKLGAEHPSVAAAVRNLARIEFDRGEAAAAETLLQEALAAQTKTLGADHPALAPTRLARARLLAYRGALDEAAREVDRAVVVLEEARGPEHPVVVRARTLRARIAVAAGDDDTAFREASTASRALASYTRRTFGAISDRQRSLLTEDSQEIVSALLSVQSAPPRELFVALLPHRDAVLRSIAATRAASTGGDELTRLRQRYVAAALSRGPGSANRIRELAAKIDALEARAAAQVITPEAEPDKVLAEACARLPEDAALVKFVAFDRTGTGALTDPTPALAALVVQGRGCQVKRVVLGAGSAIDDAAEDFAQAMRDERADEPAARRALTQELLVPLDPAVGNADRWLVIPDGALWGIPIGVLPDPKAKGKYLFERVTIGYLTSTHELAESRGGAEIDPAALRSLLVGAPDFGSGVGPIVLTDTGPCQLQPFEALPATAKELDAVAGLVGKPSRVTGADVTRARIEKELARDPWLVHFATHAYFAGQGGCGGDGGTAWRGEERPVAPNPLLLSGIVLAGANTPNRVGSAQGGILTAYEVSGLDLRSTGLVVLSACDTGTGLQQRGQEVQGLRWGFRAAGAPALVSSLWRSNDVATSRLMRAFYEALVSGELQVDAFRGAEALRRAQLAQVEGERRFGMQRPLTWANFIFSGVL